MSRTLTPPPELCYRPAVPWHHRLPVRPLVWCAAVAAVWLSTFTWGPQAWAKVQMLYWQSRCMSFAAPPKTPQSDVGLFLAGSGSIPHEWRRLHELLDGSPPTSLGTVYLHERVSPSGNRRLVAVDVQRLPGCVEEPVPFAITRVVLPGGLFARPREPVTNDSIYLLEGAVRVLWGSSDSGDESHFTIAYQVEGGADILIDGWLRDDDTVKLERRMD